MLHLDWGGDVRFLNFCRKYALGKKVAILATSLEKQNCFNWRINLAVNYFLNIRWGTWGFLRGTQISRVLRAHIASSNTEKITGEENVKDVAWHDRIWHVFAFLSKRYLATLHGEPHICLKGIYWNALIFNAKTIVKGKVSISSLFRYQITFL